MLYELKYRIYRRRFRRPLKTARGTWRYREGILLQLIDEEGHAGWGEIAPVTGFHCESLVAALHFLESTPTVIDDASVDSVPPDLPCCRFALEWARRGPYSVRQKGPQRRLPVAALLPLGETSLVHYDQMAERGFSCFKVKIGVSVPEAEQVWFRRLHRSLASSHRLRLDANRSLTREETEAWLRLCEDHPVEFLEEPLQAADFPLFNQWRERFVTAIALDESIDSFSHVRELTEAGWDAPIVIKPAIMEGIGTLVSGNTMIQQKWVFSSVFETGIGFQAGLELASLAHSSTFALGYGTNALFEDDGLSPHGVAPSYRAGDMEAMTLQSVWEQACKH